MQKTLATIAVLAVASLSLTGCIKETSSLSVSKSQKVTGKIQAVLDNEFLDFIQANSESEVPGAADMSRAEFIQEWLLEDEGPEATDLPRGVKIKVVSGKNYSGIKYVFTKASLKAVNKVGKYSSPAQKKPLLQIKLNARKQVAFTYRVFGAQELELTAAEYAEMPKAQYKVTAKFPGKVIKTNGKKTKRTVVWKGKHALKTKKLTAVSKRK